MIRALIIDRDSVINHASKDPSSPLYYITDWADFCFKPNVHEAFGLLEVLQRRTGLKVYLATKQRCVSKGIVSRSKIDAINDTMQDHLGFHFDGVYVEESAPDKRALFAAIAADSGIEPHDMHLIDDSPSEAEVFKSIGGRTWATGEYANLYAEVCSLFAIS